MSAPPCDPAAIVGTHFGLHVRGPATHLRHAGHADCWRLPTDGGDVFVKAVDTEDMADAFRTGARFEARAHAAGVSMPAPLPSVDGQFAVPVVGRFVTVHRWTSGRSLEPSDRPEPWLGRTLATMTALEPATAARSWCYRLPGADEWADLAARGRATGQAWHPLLTDRAALLAEVQDRIATAVTAAGIYAVCHPDIEPWNVMVTPSGPMLTDWSLATGDAVPLVVAHAAHSFANRDGHFRPDRLRDVVTAYREAGGDPLGPGDGLLSRRLAMMLSRLHERLRASLGEPVGLDPLEASHTSVARLRDLPAYTETLREQERLLPRD